MELVVRKTELLRELQLFQGIVERKNTIPILANVLVEADGEEVRLLATDLEVGLRSRCQASVARPGSVTVPAKKLYEIRQGAARDRRADRGGQGRRQSGSGSFRLAPADAAARGLSHAARSRDRRRGRAAGGNAAADGREDAVRHHRRGHALLPERGAVRAQERRDEPGGDRWSPVGARERAAGRRQEGQGGGRDARDPAAQDADGARPAAGRAGRRRHVLARREPSVLPHRRPRADLAHDRRAVSGVRARHPQGERQARGLRAGPADQRRQARGAPVERAVARSALPGGQGQGRDRVEQPGVRRGARRADRRLRGRADAESASTRSTCSTSSAWSKPRA